MATYAFNFGYMVIEDATGTITSIESKTDLVFTLPDEEQPFIYEEDGSLDLVNTFSEVKIGGFDDDVVFSDPPRIEIAVVAQDGETTRFIRLIDETDPNAVRIYTVVIDSTGLPDLSSDQAIIDFYSSSNISFLLGGNNTLTPGNDFFIVSDETVDVVVGTGNSDFFNLGDGDDYADGAEFGDNIAGGNGNDSLLGNVGDDTLSGNDDNDTIRGGEGNDTIFAGAGQDRIYDGLGDDVIFAGTGFDRIYLEDLVEGSDTVNGGADTDTLEGDLRDYDGTGLDVTLDIDAGTIVTSADGSGADADSFSSVEVFRFLGDADITIEGGEGAIRFFTDLGNDTFNGSEFDEEIFSGDGDDLLIGGLGADRLFSGEGNDVAIGGGGGDIMGMLGGDDSASGGFGNDTLFGVDGNDTLRGEGNNDFVWGGRDDDSLFGGEGNDEIAGFFGQDTLFGGSGNDTLFASFDDDEVYGGGGEDKVYGGAGNDTMEGNGGNDTMFGAADDDTMTGDDGDDVINGNFGNDTINGGTGTDTINLGAGTDTFDFRNGDESDTVTDYDTAEDSLLLDTALWSELAPGTINTAQDVVDEFGSFNAGVATLDFGGGDVLTLEGTIASLADLATTIDDTGF